MATSFKYMCITCLEHLNDEASKAEHIRNKDKKCSKPKITEVSWAPHKDKRPSDYKPYNLKSGYAPQQSASPPASSPAPAPPPPPKAQPIQEQSGSHRRYSTPEYGMRTTEIPYSRDHYIGDYVDSSPWKRAKPWDYYSSDDHSDYYLEYRYVRKSPMAQRFVGLVGPEIDSPQGVTLSKALKRFHHTLDVFGLGPTNAAGRLARERPLWQNLRMRRNEFGEVELLV